MAARWAKPVTLEGRIVRLEPMSRAHLDGLAEVALDPELWRWTIARPTDRASLEAWMATAMDGAAAGTEVPFVTVERASGRPIGSSRYMNIVPEHRRLEIGWSWVATDWQRGGANREAKLLMLGHAFEALDCNRVEFKTDSLNERSRRALLGIGATFEGIFRNHMIMPDHRLRHSAYYSVIDTEWPAVKTGLSSGLDELLGTSAGG
ncbi:MAG: GNAT family N-acetyltransferase [Chloroflexota bacterium]|nr:GNAT family N-acetyltransferase [Chloroflexota bacterium]